MDQQQCKIQLLGPALENIISISISCYLQAQQQYQGLNKWQTHNNMGHQQAKPTQEQEAHH